MDCSPPGSSVHGIFFFFFRQNTGAGCNFLLQGIFLTPGSEWASLASPAWVTTVPPGKPCNNQCPLFAACFPAVVRVPLPCPGMMPHSGGSPLHVDAPHLPVRWTPPAPVVWPRLPASCPPEFSVTAVSRIHTLGPHISPSRLSAGHLPSYYVPGRGESDYFSVFGGLCGWRRRRRIMSWTPGRGPSGGCTAPRGVHGSRPSSSE